jgi:hypothetical protein
MQADAEPRRHFRCPLFDRGFYRGVGRKFLELLKEVLPEERNFGLLLNAYPLPTKLAHAVLGQSR